MLDFYFLPRFRDYRFELGIKTAEWATAYGVEPEAIERQIYIAHAWIESNKRKAPKKDPMRFLFNWMGIAKKRGTLVSKSSNQLYKEEKPDDSEVMTGDDFKRMKEAIGIKRQ